MRALLPCIVMLVMFSSCREIRSLEPDDVTDGYELRGRVTSQNGIPLDSVAVTLHYDVSFVSPMVVDTIPVVVRDSTKILFVAVFTPGNRYVRELFFGFRQTGPVPRFRWDERDDNAVIVPSGGYVVRYVVDTVIVKNVRVLADGNISAYTDENGEFVLTNDRFPIGQEFGLFTAQDEYAGLYNVRNEVELRFTKGTFVSTYVVTMNVNTITRSTFTLQ